MAATTCTSSTSTISGTDPNFTLTHKIRNKESGVFLYIKYTAGTTTSITVTPKTICSVLSSTDQYNMVQATGVALTALAYTISSAGNYKIPISVADGDDTIVITIVPNAGDGGGTLVANIMIQ